MKSIEIVLTGRLRDDGYFTGFATIGDSESKPYFFLPLEDIFDVSQLLIEGYDVQVRYIFDESSEDYVLELGLAESEGEDD
jgi:hypothetical protein